MAEADGKGLVMLTHIKENKTTVNSTMVVAEAVVAARRQRRWRQWRWWKTAAVVAAVEAVEDN